MRFYLIATHVASSSLTLLARAHREVGEWEEECGRRSRKTVRREEGGGEREREREREREITGRDRKRDRDREDSKRPT